MTINFYPEYDNAELEKAAEEYQQIWNEEGYSITTTIEKTSGLKFQESIINSVISKNMFPWARPLMLLPDLSLGHKKWSIMHELCHRLMRGNNLELKDYTIKNTHKQIDLILFDVACDLYGEAFTKDAIDYEISLWTGKGISPYKIAWNWALAMTKEERQKEFKKYFPK